MPVAPTVLPVLTPVSSFAELSSQHADPELKGVRSSCLSSSSSSSSSNWSGATATTNSSNSAADSTAAVSAIALEFTFPPAGNRPSTSRRSSISDSYCSSEAGHAVYHNDNAFPKQANGSEGATPGVSCAALRRTDSTKKQQQQQLGVQQLWDGGSSCEINKHPQVGAQQHCGKPHMHLYSELDARLSELLTLREKVTAKTVTAHEAIQTVAAGTAAEQSFVSHRLQQQSYTAQTLGRQTGSNSSSSRISSSSSGGDSDLRYNSWQQQQQQLPLVASATTSPAVSACLQQQQLMLRVTPELPVVGAELQRSSSKQTGTDLCQSHFGEVHRASFIPADTAGAGDVQGLLHLQQQQQWQQQVCAAERNGGWQGDGAGELGFGMVLKAAEHKIWQLKELQELQQKLQKELLELLR